MNHSNPLRSPEAAALLRDRGALKKLLSSPEAKRLLEQLSPQDTARLRQAADRVRQGDTAALQSAAADLMARPESAALLRQLGGRLPGKK